MELEARSPVRTGVGHPSPLHVLSAVLVTCVQDALVQLLQGVYLPPQATFILLPVLLRTGERLKHRSTMSSTPRAPVTPLLGNCSQKEKRATCMNMAIAA